MSMLSRKLTKQFPWLQSQGNVSLFVIALLLVGMLSLVIFVGYRDGAAIADCKARGGNPIYKTLTREMPSGDGTTNYRENYQVFDRCSV